MEFSLDNFFDSEKCVGCGKCLIECPVLQYDETRAKEEKARLVRGEDTEVLSKCKSCFSCNTFCPHDCNPYGLILYRWFERYREKGIPVRALSSLPVQDKNFVHFARKSYTPEEKKITDKWRENAHGDQSGKNVIFAGCNAWIFPYLLSTPLLSGTDIIGDESLCCGEVYYRMGLFDRVEKLAKELQERYRDIKPGRVIMFCMAGYNMQKNILPKQFGIKWDFEHVYIGNWLLEKVKSGEIEFTRPLYKKVVLQESCHGKALGDDYMEKPRELLKLAGARVVEMEPARERQICCGVADGITRFNPIDMMRGGTRQWRMAQSTGADIFAAYCGTCYLMLKMAGKQYFSGLECLHLLELLDKAAGGNMVSLGSQRAGKVLKGVVFSSTGRLLSKNRIFPEKT